MDFKGVVIGLLQVLSALFVLGLGTERGTQVIKSFLNKIGEKYPLFLFKDKKSFLLAAVIGLAVGYYFKVDVTHYLAWFNGYDADLVQAINALLLVVGGNLVHDKLFKATAK